MTPHQKSLHRGMVKFDNINTQIMRISFIYKQKQVTIKHESFSMAEHLTYIKDLKVLATKFLIHEINILIDLTR
jgi:hypothetical protein